MSKTFGPNLGLLVGANTGEVFDTEFRSFLRGVDFFGQPIVKQVGLNTPPGSPVDGDAYVVGGSPSGVWSTAANKIARYSSAAAAWEFYTPHANFWVSDLTTGNDYAYSGSAWAVWATPDSGLVHIAGTETITGTKTFSGITTISNTTDSSGTGSGCLVLSGGLGVAKNVYIGGIVSMSNSTGSSSTTTGAFVVVGGLGVGGQINCGSINTQGGNFTVNTAANPAMNLHDTAASKTWGIYYQNSATKFWIASEQGVADWVSVTNGTGVLTVVSTQAIALDVKGGVSVATGKTYQVNGTQVVAARKTGWSTWTGTATRTSFATSTATLQNVAEALKALIDDFHATAGHGLLGT